jgi:hypothetical protein
MWGNAQGAMKQIKFDRFRSELSRSELEHSVRFTRLHQKRATVIATTYAHLDALHRKVRAMLQYVSTEEECPEGWSDARAAYNELATGRFVTSYLYQQVSFEIALPGTIPGL